MEESPGDRPGLSEVVQGGCDGANGRAIEITRKEQRAMLFGLVDERHVSPLGQPGPLAT